MAGNQYVSSVKYAAVPVWTAAATLAVGAFRRQTAPADSVARVFRVSSITTGVTGGTEPAWQTAAGLTTADSGVTWTEVTGNPTYNWNAPHKCIQNAVQSGWGSTSSCFIYVDSAHNFASVSGTAISWTGFNLSQGAVRRIVSVNATGSIPPGPADLLPGATETVTGTASFSNAPQSGTYVDGVFVVVGAGSAATANVVMLVNSGVGSVTRWRNGGITLASTGAASNVQLGTTLNGVAGDVEFTNFVWKFAATGQQITLWACRWLMTGGSVDGSGSIPAAFIDVTKAQNCYGIIQGMDLSALSGATVDVSLAEAVAVTSDTFTAKPPTGAIVPGAEGECALFVTVPGFDDDVTGYRVTMPGGPRVTLAGDLRISMAGAVRVTMTAETGDPRVTTAGNKRITLQ